MNEWSNERNIGWSGDLVIWWFGDRWPVIERVNDWKSEWMNGWMIEWVNGWMGEWLNDWMSSCWVVELLNCWIAKFGLVSFGDGAEWINSEDFWLVCDHDIVFFGKVVFILNLVGKSKKMYNRLKLNHKRFINHPAFFYVFLYPVFL